MTLNNWSSDTYQRNAAYVPALGSAVLELLAPKAGERVLDIGCGDGALTEQIVAAGAETVGVDTSPQMIAAALARGLDARLANAQALQFDQEFDAVFSNAALHWVPDHDAVLDGVHRALRRGGRFVAEFGGHGNISAIEVAVRAVLERRNLGTNIRRYYPTDEEYAARLSAHGFDVRQIALIPRPTPLPTGMRGWLETFERSTLERLPEAERGPVVDDIERLLRPAVCDSSGQWTAQYVRLRFLAISK